MTYYGKETMEERWVRVALAENKELNRGNAVDFLVNHTSYPANRNVYSIKREVLKGMNSKEYSCTPNECKHIWNYLNENKFPSIEGPEDYSELVWVQIYGEVSPSATKELYVFWKPVVYWEIYGDKGFCIEQTEEDIENVVAWQYVFMPSADHSPAWCRVCSDWIFGEHECGEWLRPDECTCTPYHSNESGTIEETVCDHCKDKSDEIPF